MRELMGVTNQFCASTGADLDLRLSVNVCVLDKLFCFLFQPGAARLFRKFVVRRSLLREH